MSEDARRSGGGMVGRRPCDDHAPKSSAFQRGYVDFDRNVDRCDCPETTEQDREDWEAGWDQASVVDWERRNGEGRP